MWGSRDPLLEFLDPRNISGTVKSRNFIFGTEMEGSEYEEKKSKFGQRGHVGVTCPTFGILGPPNISGTVKARNFKFAIEMDGNEY